jgi:hypothetical protein
MSCPTGDLSRATVAWYAAVLKCNFEGAGQLDQRLLGAGR